MYTQIMRSKPGSLGFTLLELLVVISIIGILVAISAVSFTTAQRQSRDSRRRSDIKAIQNAFEQYNSGNSGAYASALAVPPTTCADMLTGHITGAAPNDPQSGDAYTDTAVCEASAYCICAQLEIEGTGNATGPCSGSSTPTYSSGLGTESYWCGSNLQ